MVPYAAKSLPVPLPENVDAFVLKACRLWCADEELLKEGSTGERGA